MTTIPADSASEQRPRHLGLASAMAADRLTDPAYQADLILRTAFVVAPILFGLDKFFNWMTFWAKYLWFAPRRFARKTS